jgi:UDP-N-acetyl-2-amino-2-deoxyglucuronate dehydrogenase
MRFRFGLLGAGGVAHTHAQAIRLLPDVEVVAVADVDQGRAETLARQYGIPHAFRSAEELLRRVEVDAVDIVAPHHLHLPLTLVAAQSGRHVLAEKAIAQDAASADAMIEACRTAGVVLGGIFQNRFSPAGRALRETVQSGSLGRAFLASVSVKVRRTAAYFEGATWRGRREEAGGGVLMIQAIHTLDLLQWVMGMPRRVLARTATAVHPVAVEDVAVGLLEFEGGATAVLQATTAVVPEFPPELEIHGERGTAMVFDSRGYLGFWSSTLDRPTPLPDRWALYASQYHEQDASVPAQASPEPHAENIRDFVAAVREGRPPLVDGTEARKALLLVDTLYRSAARGTWVDLP